MPSAAGSCLRPPPLFAEGGADGDYCFFVNPLQGPREKLLRDREREREDYYH